MTEKYEIIYPTGTWTDLDQVIESANSNYRFRMLTKETDDTDSLHVIYEITGEPEDIDLCLYELTDGNKLKVNRI